MKEMLSMWTWIALSLSAFLTTISISLTSRSKISIEHKRLFIKKFLLLRIIHVSWIFWFFTFLFTTIISPYMFSLYQIPYLIPIVLILFIAFSVVGGYKLGEYLITEIYQKCELSERILWFSSIVSLILFPIVTIIDTLSICAESYFNIVSQYCVYTISVTLLLITTFILTLPLIIILRKRKVKTGGRGHVQKNV